MRSRGTPGRAAAGLVDAPICLANQMHGGACDLTMSGKISETMMLAKRMTSVCFDYSFPFILRESRSPLL